MICIKPTILFKRSLKYKTLRSNTHNISPTAVYPDIATRFSRSECYMNEMMNAFC